MLRRSLAVQCIASLILLFGTSRLTCAQQDTTKVFDPVQTSTLAGTLRAVTLGSGNPGVGDVLSTLTGIEVGTAPLGSPSGGLVYSFDEAVGGAIRRSGTFGPHFLERALTTGRGTTSFGVNVFHATYDTISGHDLDDLRISTFRGAAPLLESATLNLRLRSQTAAIFGSVGVTDDFDVAVTVPVVRVDMDMTLVQEEGIFTAILPGHGSSTGLGDVALMGKWRFWKSDDERSGLAALVTLRAPTGNEDQLRGISPWRTQVGATASAALGSRVSVHASGSYEWWDKSVALTNTVPGTQTTETWFLSDQMLYGAAVEFEVHQTLTLSLEGMTRRVRNAGRLGTVAFDVSGPNVDQLELLQATSADLHKIVVVPAVKWNLGGNTLLSFGVRMAQGDTGLRDKFTPLLGFNWTLSRAS